MLKQFFKSLLLLMCVCVPCGMQAKTITSEEAARIATDFFSAGNVSRLSSIDALELVCASKKSDGTPVYYVFNAKDSRGFIIIRLTTMLFLLWATLMSRHSCRTMFPMLR